MIIEGEVFWNKTTSYFVSREAFELKHKWIYYRQESDKVWCQCVVGAKRNTEEVFENNMKTLKGGSGYTWGGKVYFDEEARTFVDQKPERIERDYPENWGEWT